ncbi:competence protein [Pontibacillus yanchengensis]|uniref:Competence protein n=3 Tax=Pontibacillus yanchengensis TaxID=462910 RepID=A0ACC7VG45_9BACI|nr:competence protein [Pontibacillus yanchengensis]MYL52899.1 competence protein [Pontibacillus yanchengensis]
MLNMLWKEHFEVTPFTQAVVADKDENGKTVSYVFEGNEGFYVNSTPKKLIDQACKYFGSSLRGRQDGTKDVSGITHKAPIAIDPVSGMYFFPTTSPQHSNCSWISHTHIDHVKRAKDDMSTIIVFKNQKNVKLTISHGSLLNQIQRTAQFRYKLTERFHTYPKQGSYDHVAEPFVSST